MDQCTVAAEQRVLVFLAILEFMVVNAGCFDYLPHVLSMLIQMSESV